MFRTRIGRRKYVIFAMCLVWFFVFSTITSLENSSVIESSNVELTKGPFTESAIDFSALWNRTYGGFDSDRFLDSTKCRDGGYAFVGYTQSFSSDQDIWVVRTNANGDVLWTTTLSEATGDDYGESIIECENGDFVIVGSSYHTGDYEARIDRISSDGSVLWSHLIGENATTDGFYDVVESPTGSLVAVGRTDSWGSSSFDVVAVCFSPVGNEVWMRTYGGAASDVATSVITCSDGGYAILGETVSFGEGGLDFWLLRIDNQGNLLWDQTYGGSQTEYARDVIECVVGGFLMVGKSSSFGDIPGDFWAIKVDALGFEDWNQTYVGIGEDIAFGVIQAMKGGYTIVGCDDFIGPDPSVRITRIDLDGTELWSEWYGGGNVDYGYTIQEVSPEEYVVGGSTNTYGSGSFDGWVFLVPGEPVLDNPPDEAFFDYGQIPSVTIPVYSTAEIHTSYISGSYSGVFNVVHLENEIQVYTFDVLDVGFYDLFIHINNTAGHEIMHILWIYVDDTTAPTWSDFTAVHFLEFGDDFQYTPTAYDLSPLDEWFLTGSTYFTIDVGSGEISNVGTPPVGEYNLEIQVNDRYHNSLFDGLQILVQDTTAPEWDTALEDHTIDYGVNFVYDLNASDLAGISSWSVDNTEFSVDSEGRVRNLIALAPGVHAVTVSVSDVNGNVLQGQFTVTVGSPPTTPGGVVVPGIVDSAILFGAGVVATLVVTAVVCSVGRRKTPAK